MPGAVRGWEALAHLGARLSRRDHLRDAVTAARDGVAVSASLALCLAGEWATLTDPSFRTTFGGREDGPLRRGDLLRQPRLADTLDELARSGYGSFYAGALAERLVAALAARGSEVTAADFAEFAVDSAAPLARDWRGMRVHTLGPNTQGFALLRTALAVESDPAPDPVRIARLFAEGNLLRDTRLGDPRRTRVDVRALIEDAVDLAEPELVPDPRLARGDTIGVAAADAEGWAVSLVQSQFHLFGSGVHDAETGVLFHNRGYSFVLDEHAPGVLAPRARPAHTLMPVLVTDPGGGVRFVQATMGGKAQAQIHAHLLLHLARGATASETVSAPRWTLGPYAPGDRSDAVYAEADVEDAVVQRLHDAGHPIVTVPPLTEMLGHANVVRRTATGFDAAADPRSDGAASVS